VIKRTYVVERLVDGVLNELWKACWGPMRAATSEEVLAAFRRSDSPLREWARVRVVELTVAQQAKAYAVASATRFTISTTRCVTTS
jgi:hypothetical protein